jgi:aminomethyltransferase
MADYRRTVLCDLQLAQGARLVPFCEWEMPVEYSGISKEHRGVRTGVGLFDVSHMGEFFVRGPESLDLLQYVTTNDVARLSDGAVQYTTMASEEGTVVDDLLLYRMGRDQYMMVVNAANIDSDFHWLRTQNSFDSRLEDVSEQTTLLAVQGPSAQEMLQAVTEANLSALASFRCIETRVAQVEGILSRTGYTGEDGFEFYFSNSDAHTVWGTFLDAGKSFGILPAGLGARNTLRLEAGMLLHGHDMDHTTTPIEAGIGWVVKLEKGEFIGREALLRQAEAGVTRKLAGFQMLGPQIAREGYPVLVDGHTVGRVTSGGPSITLKKNIGLTYLPVEHAVNGTRLQVQIRKGVGEAEVVPTPFYKRRASI